MPTPVDPARVLADLDALHALTGRGGAGAFRVAWTGGWAAARAWLRGRLDEIGGVRVETDEAGNLWATRAAPGEPVIAVGSHLDSVPAGGRLDGALGVLAALEVLRTTDGIALVDSADEEGARFGHSLLGSAAAAGMLDVGVARGLTDAGGVALPDALAAHGVTLEAMPRAAVRLRGLRAYLELHIEQGPVLEARGEPVAAVTGCYGVERHRLTFAGRGGHAGTVPMAMRDDPLVAAARMAVAVPEIAARHGGVGTVGAIEAQPGIPTAIPGTARAWLDLRNGDAGALATMLADVLATAPDATAEPVWAIVPIPFDPRLVALAAEACGGTEPLASGALHDAAAVARAGVPTAMIFVQSRGGISHAPDEHSEPGHVAAGVQALARLARAALLH